ncbi:MAG: PH domain-containing protein [Nitrosopumilus sp.]|nr:PH domain-containing protein [Nitrosopumilus sp.]
MKEQLRSKRNIILTGILLLVIVGLFGLIGTLGIIKAIEDYRTGNFWSKPLFMPVIFIPFVFYSIYYFLTYFPTFKIDKTGIEVSTIFKTKFYNWSQIKRIEITGKQPCKFLFVSMPVEATTIQFIDNSEIYLWVDYYRNKSDLRVILDRANIILQANKEFSRLDFNTDRPDFSKQLPTDCDGKEFNGNHFLTFNGVIFYGWIGYFTYLSLTIENNPLKNLAGLIALPLVLLSIPALVSYQMHYFVVGQDYLIIKNTLWFWKTHIYLLKDIKEVVIETPHRLSTSLRVITNDYRDKLYPAGSLSDKTWSEMMEQLDNDKIKVRNEAI